MDEQVSTAQLQDIVDHLRASPFAEAFASGAPLFVAGGEPLQLTYCNASMLELFGAAGPVELSVALLSGDSQGARRLRHLAAAPPHGAPRLELLRFFAGRMPIRIGLMCARLMNARGEAYLAASPPPLSSRRAAQPEVPAPLEPAEVVDTPDPATARFVWSSDAEGRLTAPSPMLLQRVGRHAPDTLETLDHWRARLGAGDFGGLVAAIAGRAMFRSVRLLWPSADGKQNLVALLSGSPVHDRQRQFLGYRGFGVFTGESEALPNATAAVDEAPVDADRAPPAANANASQETETPASRPGEPAAPPPTERSAEIVALRPPHATLPGRPNVVPIRRGPMRVLTETAGRHNNGDSVALTTDERDAFREIALALGARIRVRDERAASQSGDPPPPPEGKAPNADTVDRPRDLIDLSRPSSAAATAPDASDSASPSEAAIADDDAHRLLDILPIGVLVTRGDEALYLNRTLLDLLGYSDIKEFVQACGLAHMFKGHEPEQATPMGEGGPLSLIAANGDLIAVSGQLQAIEWGGAAASLISLRRSLDAEYVEKLSALESEVRRHAARALDAPTMLDKASDGVVTIDRDGAILSVSRRAGALLGYEEAEIVREAFALLLSPESRDAAGEHLAANWDASPSDPARTNLEVVTQERRGRQNHLLLTIVDAGVADQRLVVLRDLTDWAASLRDAQTARGEAERASTLKSDMLSAISHEIRTPLNAILGFAEVMRDERFGPIGNERYKQYVNDIHLSGGHVLSLVNDLLDLSKIEAGKFDLDFLPLDANRIIQECVALMQPHAARERIIVRLSLFDKLPPVVADERSLRQIVLNLMSNAVKFNEPGGQVIVSTAVSEAHQAVIRVRDTGIGMSESELVAALEPFRQVSSKRRVGGTGLGLPLTKALVEANRAAFSINSRKEQGTLVELTFPIAHAAAAQ
jgi:PAS domain S-box-containing protein